MSAVKVALPHNAGGTVTSSAKRVVEPGGSGGSALPNPSTSNEESSSDESSLNSEKSWTEFTPHKSSDNRHYVIGECAQSPSAL